MQHIRPYPVSGHEVINYLGKDWICPYCKSESPATGKDDIGWIPTPLHLSSKKYICLGCCEDIYSTCASDNFDLHPYKNIVIDAAQHEGCSVNEFRVQCIRQQIVSGKDRIEQEQDTGRYKDRLTKLESLLILLQAK